MAEDQSDPAAVKEEQPAPTTTTKHTTLASSEPEETPPKEKKPTQEDDDESQSIKLELELEDSEETKQIKKDEQSKPADEGEPIKSHEGENDKETENSNVVERKLVEIEVDAAPSREAGRQDDDREKEKPENDEDVEKKAEQALSPEKITEGAEQPASSAAEEQQQQQPSVDRPVKALEEQAPKEERRERAEVGIVGPPTAACDLLSEAELGPALPTAAPKLADRVSRWVENAAAKVDEPDDIDDDVEDNGDDELEHEEELQQIDGLKKTRGRKRRCSSNGTSDAPPATRKAQKVVSNIIRRSIRCLNKMHAMDGSGVGKNSSGEKGRGAEDDEESRKSPKVPQSQQNGAALPEEAASADRSLLHCQSPAVLAKRDKKNADPSQQDSQSAISKTAKQQTEQTSPNKPGRPSSQRSSAIKQSQPEELRDHCLRETRKRRSIDSTLSAATAAAAGASVGANGSSSPKKLCLDQREQFISSLMGISDKFTVDQLSARAEQLRAEVQDLDELARAKEMEWNEILSMRKLKEEAYLRLERRRQILGFMESSGGGGSNGSESILPPASLALLQQNFEHRGLLIPKEEPKRDRAAKAAASIYQQAAAKLENGPRIDTQSPDNRQIGEGRQGPIVDVRSIIADYRLRHPETVPRRRGRRMRNSVNVGLGAGGAMVETVGNMDSRPSSTDSCKSNPNINDPNSAMSFKDVLVQFAKLSQQQGEPIKTPQNYPDVTLHPVAATTTPIAMQNSSSAPQQQPQQQQQQQPSGSLLHGILTKSQSPRPTTFSPTLARLLTAPERERSAAAAAAAAAPPITPTPHQTATQHLLQAYQGANPVSISDFLSSSKARTEITITPVVNNPIQTHSNNAIHVDDVEEETSIIEERDSRLCISTRDNRDDRDSPPRCQGCHERAAQFVCAGCGNQWYCSRECQVAAWDDHSDACSP